LAASLATLAAMTGMHLAMSELSRIPADAERLRAANDNLNRKLVVTCQGQINDLWNETTGASPQKQIENVLVWKTAYYSFVNPLQLGAPSRFPMTFLGCSALPTTPANCQWTTCAKASEHC
jgi:geranylgeranyl pyrophosphate synthase